MSQPIPDSELRAFVDRVFNALLAVESRRPAQAVRLLENLLERNHGVVRNALLIRADAHFQLKQHEAAERDYRAALGRPASGLFNLAGPLAQAGLARTLAAAGKPDEARAEYQKLLEMWKDADADLALVKELRAELARLQS